jgi:hypothetical protein
MTKPAPHPSHRRVTNVSGHVRASGKVVKGYSRVSNNLPRGYDPSYTCGANVVPIDSGPKSIITGPSGPDQAW